MDRMTTLVALYVPGDRPDRFDKAARSGADAIIIDLEDSVAPDRKAMARSATSEYLATPPHCPVVVRINESGTPWYAADLAMSIGVPNLSGIRLPKAEIAAQIEDASNRSGGRRVQAVVETALGVENLLEIASAPATASVSLGEADLRSALGITAADGLDWIRARLVVAASAAGLPPPMMSVWTSLADPAGLAVSCTEGRARGFVGRAAIHPSQVPVIREAFAPTADQLRGAREVLSALDTAAARSSGVAVLADGRMIDGAMRRAAERLLALAELHGGR